MSAPFFNSPACGGGVDALLKARRWGISREGIPPRNSLRFACEFPLPLKGGAKTEQAS